MEHMMRKQYSNQSVSSAGAPHTARLKSSDAGYHDDDNVSTISSAVSSSDSQYDDTTNLKIIRPPSYASVQKYYRKRPRKDGAGASSISEIDSDAELSKYSRSRRTETGYSSVYSYLASSFAPIQRKTSIYGPTGTPKERAVFLAVISLMTFCGANNDFLGKICYQSLPGIYSGFVGLHNRYWIAWLLTFGTFGVCALALLVGWNKGGEWKNMRKQFSEFFFNVSIAGSCDVWVNGGRYVGLVFLPASVVTILKNGTQLLFSALFRITFEKKTLSKLQSLGILCVVIGLVLVSIASFLNEGNSGSFGGTLIGIFILTTVGLFGSLRNHYEQALCRDMQFNANYVVGIRSFVSMFWTIVIGIALLCIPVLYETESNPSPTVATGWQQISSGVLFICSYPIFLIGFVLFLLAIYGKNVTQMKVIEMSSALTRNLLMQLMPIGTWILSLIFYYIDPAYGEQWNIYSYVRLVGFIIVLFGSYLYMKIPKEELDVLQQEQIKRIMSSIKTPMDAAYVDLYGNDVILPVTPPPASPNKLPSAHQLLDKTESFGQLYDHDPNRDIPLTDLEKK